MTTAHVKKNTNGLFEITLFVKNPMDDLYDTLKFSGLFTSQEDADSLKTKVLNKLSDHYGNIHILDFAHWIWKASKNSAVVALRSEPTAKNWIVGQDPIPAA